MVKTTPQPQKHFLHDIFCLVGIPLFCVEDQRGTMSVDPSAEFVGLQRLKIFRHRRGDLWIQLHDVSSQRGFGIKFGGSGFRPSSNGFGGASEMFGNIIEGLTALIDEADGFRAKFLRKPPGRFRFLWHSNNPFLWQYDGKILSVKIGVGQSSTSMLKGHKEKSNQ